MKLSIEKCKIQLVTIVKQQNLIDVKLLYIWTLKIYYLDNCMVKKTWYGHVIKIRLINEN
jgi:hypothetical protein